MGLDNMPHEYPCKRQGTAVIEKRTHTWEDEDGNTQSEDSYPIDCEATIKVGGCPYTNANPPKTGAVVGMFGTHCWYRGKYGNWLINALKTDPADAKEEISSYVWDTDGDDSFYGTDPEGLYRPPEACASLADQMESALDERGGKLTFASEPDDDDGELTDEVLYAIWYLRWVAEHCDGMDAWY